MTLRTIALAAACAAVAWAHDPITTKLTWSKEISRVFVKRCITCHQPGGSAPFSLAKYEAARPWAVAIRDEVSNRTMPPWGAVKGFGEFQNDASLSQEEISLIIDWVNGGAPEGDPQFAPQGLPNLYSPSIAPGRTLPLEGQVTLPRPAHLTGIRPKALADGAEAQVVLSMPDGAVEPLVWFKNWKQKFAHDFVFRTPVDAPKGAQVLVIGSASGAPVSLELLAEDSRP